MTEIYNSIYNAVTNALNECFAPGGVGAEAIQLAVDKVCFCYK